MAFMKHVGKHGDRKVCIVYRQVPGDDHMCLVIYPETLHAHWQDAVQKVLESEIKEVLAKEDLEEAIDFLLNLDQENSCRIVICGSLYLARDFKNLV